MPMDIIDLLKENQQRNKTKHKQKGVRQRPKNTAESLSALNSGELCEEVRGGQQNTRLGH